MSKTIDTQVEKVRKLVEGMLRNRDKLSAKGLSVDNIDQLTRDIEKLNASSEKYEAMKAECSAQSKLTHELLDKLKEDYAPFRNLIRNNFPQEQWIEFGLQDKR